MVDVLHLFMPSGPDILCAVDEKFIINLVGVSRIFEDEGAG